MIFIKILDGAFAENFYGMRRIDLDVAKPDGNSSKERLTRKSRNVSLFFLVNNYIDFNN